MRKKEIRICGECYEYQFEVHKEFNFTGYCRRYKKIRNRNEKCLIYDTALAADVQNVIQGIDEP